jgi:hypothetical protein
VAKAYRLLKTILNTAVADEVLPRNPCMVRGAGSERTPERVPPTLAEAHTLAEAIEPRWRLQFVDDPERLTDAEPVIKVRPRPASSTNPRGLPRRQV